MSIRVNNQEVGLNTQSITADPNRLAQPSRGRNVIAASDGDHFSFSTTAQNVSAAVESDSASRSARLQHLAGLVVSGKYEAPAQDLSRSLIAGAIKVF
jgi:hypothetical protein